MKRVAFDKHLEKKLEEVKLARLFLEEAYLNEDLKQFLFIFFFHLFNLK